MDKALKSLLARLRFSILISLAKRAIFVRDDLGDWLRGQADPTARVSTEQVSIASGSKRLDGRLLLPQSTAHRSVLILHGIGERLAYWQTAQDLLSRHGIASLIFDYSGYGESTGATTPENLKRDTVAAYGYLRSILPGERSPFLLGLSLGTGVAVDTAPELHPAPSGVILCEAFTSLRGAAEAVLATLAFPRIVVHLLAKLMPDLYRTTDSIGRITSPLLILHSDCDELFPVEMAHDIFSAASKHGSAPANIFVAHGYAHNDAYLMPTLDYWQPILDFILLNNTTVGR